MKNNNAKKLMELFEENEEVFNTTIEAYDDSHSLLDEDRWYEMSELDDHLWGTTPTDIIDMLDGNFTTSDWYFRLKWGCLESADEKDYSNYLTEGFVDNVIYHGYDSLYPEEVNRLINSEPMLSKDDRAFIDMFIDYENKSIYVNEFGYPYLRVYVNETKYEATLRTGMFDFIEPNEEVSFLTLAKLEVEGE